jgi:eukaryotic-like serine/threonine-protein kinase
VLLEALPETWTFAEDDEIVPGLHAVRLLGGGTKHEAYLAWDRRLHALVVVKLLRPAFAGDRSARASLRAEGEALASLAHPGLPRVFGGDPEGERPHLALEHLDSPRLSTVIRRYHPALEQAIPLAVSLCSVLHYLREEGWLHLDVKPKNVILGSPPRLIDLSVARRVETVASISAPIGTDAYMAPEQCDPARFRQIGAATDIWGLGVTLYETLARRLPFAAPDRSAISLSDRYPQTAAIPEALPGGIPESVSHAVLACLSADPAERPAAAELSSVLEQVEATLPRPRLGRFRPADRR